MPIQREVIEYDVVVVGAGPAGLSAAVRLKQLARDADKELSVCVLEKGSEVGAHTLSGAILETRALDELFPQWRNMDSPVITPVERDELYFFTGESTSVELPSMIVPRTMCNEGNYVVSMGKVVRWLAQQADSLGVDIYAGYAAQDAIIEGGVVRGVVTGDMGVSRNGNQKDTYAPGIELRAQYTLLAEGARGHLGKRLIEVFRLGLHRDPQHYGIGLKELWQVPADRHKPGLVVHSVGWPLDKANPGGGFLYHLEDSQVAVGLIVDLSYSNPHLSPFDEFQRLKHHPVMREHLSGGKRIGYGARAITKGGYNSLPHCVFPGGLLIGCDAGTLNSAKIKGNHTAMKSGMLAAEVVVEHISAEGVAGQSLEGYADKFRKSWIHDELYKARNFGPAIHQFGPLLGGAINYIDQNWFGGRAPWTLRDRRPDHLMLKLASLAKKIKYPKPDGILSFDKLSSVFLSNTNHDEDQPTHLKLADPDIPVSQNLPLYDEPAQRYCPAGVYEIVEDDSQKQFRINAQNCVHCKVCDIKDPAQNITWVPPEGGGGPNYSAM